MYSIYFILASPIFIDCGQEWEKYNEKELN